MKIDINKRYRTYEGLSVDILKIYEDDQRFPVKTYVYPKNDIANGQLEEYTSNGHLRKSPKGTVSTLLIEIKPIDYILQLVIDAESYFIESHVISNSPSKNGHYNEACEKIRYAINLLTEIVNEDK